MCKRDEVRERALKQDREDSLPCTVRGFLALSPVSALMDTAHTFQWAQTEAGKTRSARHVHELRSCAINTQINTHTLPSRLPLHSSCLAAECATSSAQTGDEI